MWTINFDDLKISDLSDIFMTSAVLIILLNGIGLNVHCI